MSADQGLAASRHLAPHHKRSSSTGSHSLLFGHHSNHSHHHILHHQSSGSPDLLSDDEDDLEGSIGAANGAPELQGTLSKWTNYIHGWQDRYISLKDGSLVYFKSEIETDFGCRGAISIDKATIKQHDLDDLRFDISVSDCVWYLRAATVEDRQRWIDAIESHKRYYVDLNNVASESSSHIASVNNSLAMLSLRRHDSALSLTSTASKGGFPRGQHHRNLTEKLAEMETFRDILCRQIETLQSYFDACADVAQNMEAKDGNITNGFKQSDDHDDGRQKTSQASNAPVTKELIMQHGIHAVDFKGEAITFKATTAGILATMSNCIEIMTQREDQWRKKLEREQIARKKLEEKLKNVVKSTEVSSDTPSKTMMKIAGQEYEEGPNSQIGEDEFFDAVENALDKLQEEQNYKDKMKLMSEKSLEPEISAATQHQLWPTIEQVTNEQLHYARMKVGEGVWELFAEDGEMRMYKREEEVDGLVVDPLKALHSVRGVTAKELCHYFFAPEVRMEWETTVDQVTVLEKLAPDTLIFLQLHKRVWPAAQRDALFWSHMTHIENNLYVDDDGRTPADIWMVTNQSTKHPDAPENQGGCLRVGLTVCFVCDTYIDPGYNKETASRKHLKTNITYCSVVNPGGWAPATVLRAVFKREYPRFLKRFTQYVIDKSSDKPIQWK